MAIRVGHSPVEGTFQLAQKAGIAQKMQRDQQHNERLQLQALDQQFKQQQMEFMQRAEQEARAEEAGYQMMLGQAKRDIDMQTELATYAHQKQMLGQAMDMINNSNEFSQREKEELKIQAMSKYAGVGGGIGAGSFGQGNDSLLQRGAYKTQLLGQWQEAINNDQMTVEEAQQMSIGMGMSGAKFYTKEEAAVLPLTRQRERVMEAQKALDATGMTRDGKKIYKDDNKVDPDSPDGRLFTQLEEMRDKQTAELAKLSGQQLPGSVDDFETFKSKIPQSKELLRAKALGKTDEEMYREYHKLMTGEGEDWDSDDKWWTKNPPSRRGK
jgi:hypothetical protein